MIARLKKSKILRWIWKRIRWFGKDCFLHGILPSIYRRYARRPVNENLVIFVEYRFDQLQDSLKLLYEQITDESEKTTGLIVDIVTKAATVYIPQELETGVLYFPFFCFGKVLAAQGRITSEQQKLLGFYFDNLKLPFSRSEYIAAATKGSIIGNFQSLMAMTKTELGTFWVDLFRAFYKSGTQDGFQQIVDSVTHNIMRFSLLGNPDSQLSLGICMEFVDCANYQIKNCLDLPVEGVDWLGIVPIKDHIDEMRRIYRGLLLDKVLFRKDRGSYRKGNDTSSS